MSSQGFFTRRRVVLSLQAIAGTLNAMSLLMDLSRGSYFLAALDMLCIAVVADWLVPGDDPGRRSWVRASFRYVRGKLGLRTHDQEIEELMDLLAKMSVLLDVGKVAIQAHMDIRGTAGGLATWWSMVEAQEQLAGESIPDEAVVLNFMGSGASTAVTAGELRALLTAIYGQQNKGTEHGE